MTTRQRFRGITDWFQQNMPVAESELQYQNPYQLLVSVILSAQCTDKRVNMTTPALFDRFPTPQAMADADPEEIYPYIRSISYPNNKAKNLSGMARMLCEEFGGAVPEDIEQLQRLPGVGRKTANVVGIVAFGKRAMPVDTHVFRVADRLGLSTGAKTPLQTEMQLTEGFPPEVLPLAHHWLILHGRYVCTARKPHCEACGLTPWCRYYATQQKTAPQGNAPAEPPTRHARKRPAAALRKK
ncbi:endonuclease III [Alistipes indistinctus]|uniref:endonuclease III n=1 Tax=Alistipes indistinctus TaxID=626932 RepID=UPI00241EAE94|nr:endonuclease III [Alistipes indistinctus]